METFSLKTSQPLDPATLASPDLLSDMSDIKTPVLNSEQLDHLKNVEADGSEWNEEKETLATYELQERRGKVGEIQSNRISNTKEEMQEDSTRKAKRFSVLESLEAKNVETKSTSSRLATEDRGMACMESCLGIDKTLEQTAALMDYSQVEVVQETSEQFIVKSDGKRRPPDIKKPIRRKLRDRERSGYSSSEGEMERMSSEESLDGDAVLNESGLVLTPAVDPPASPRVVETPIGSIKDRVKALQNKVEEEEGQKPAQVQISRSPHTNTRMESEMPQLPSLPKSPRSQTERLEETMSVKELMKAFQTGQDPSKNKSGLFEHKALESCDSRELDTVQSPKSPPNPKSQYLRVPHHDNDFQRNDKADSGNLPTGILKGTSKESLLISDANFGKTVTFCDDTGDHTSRKSTEPLEKHSMSVKELTKAFQHGNEPSKSQDGLFRYTPLASPSISTPEAAALKEVASTQEAKSQIQTTTNYKSIDTREFMSDDVCFGNKVDNADAIRHDKGRTCPQTELLTGRGWGMTQEQSTSNSMTLSEDLQISPDRRPSEDFSADIKAELEESPEYQLFKKTSTALDVSFKMEGSDEESLADRLPICSSFRETISPFDNQMIDEEGFAFTHQMSNDNEVIKMTVDEPLLEEVHISRKTDRQASTSAKDMSGMMSLMKTDLDQYLQTKPVPNQTLQEIIIEENFEQIILIKEKEKDICTFSSGSIEFGTEKETDHKTMKDQSVTMEAEEAESECKKSKGAKRKSGLLSDNNDQFLKARQMPGWPEEQNNLKIKIEKETVSGQDKNRTHSSVGENDNELAGMLQLNNQSCFQDEVVNVEGKQYSTSDHGSNALFSQYDNGTEKLTIEEPQVQEVHIGRKTDYQPAATLKDISGLVSLMKTDMHQCLKTIPVTDQPPQENITEEHFEQIILIKEKEKDIHPLASDVAVFGTEQQHFEKTDIREYRHETSCSSSGEDYEGLEVAPWVNYDNEDITSDEPALVHIGRKKDYQEPTAGKDQPQEEDIIEENFEQIILTKGIEKDIHPFGSYESDFGTEEKHFEETVIREDRNKTPRSSLGDDYDKSTVAPQMNDYNEEIIMDEPLLEEFHIGKKAKHEAPTAVKEMSGLVSFKEEDLDQSLETRFVSDQSSQEYITEENFEQIILTKTIEKGNRPFGSDEAVVDLVQKHLEETDIKEDRNKTPCSSLGEDYEEFTMAPQMNDYNEEIKMDEPLLEEFHIGKKAKHEAPTEVKEMSGLVSFMEEDLDQSLETRFVSDQTSQEYITEENFEQIILTKTIEKGNRPFGSDEAVVDLEQKHLEETDIKEDRNKTPFSSLGEDYEELTMTPQMNDYNEEIIMDEPLLEEFHIGKKAKHEAPTAVKEMSGLVSFMEEDLDQSLETRFVPDQPPQENIIEDNFEQIILIKGIEEDNRLFASDKAVFDIEQEHCQETDIREDRNKTPRSSLGDAYEELTVAPNMNNYNDEILIDEPQLEEIYIGNKTNKQAHSAVKDMSGLVSFMNNDMEQSLETSLVEEYEALAVGNIEDITIDEPLLEEVRTGHETDCQTSTVKDMSGLVSIMKKDIDQRLESSPLTAQQQQEEIIEENFEQIILVKGKEKGSHPFASQVAGFGMEQKHFDETDIREDSNKTPHHSLGDDYEELKVEPKMNIDNKEIDEPQRKEVLIVKKMNNQAPTAEAAAKISTADSLEASPVIEDISSKKSPDSIEPSPTRESPCPDSLEGSPTQSEDTGDRTLHAKAAIPLPTTRQMKGIQIYKTDESSISLDTDDISSSSHKSPDSVISMYDIPTSSSLDLDPLTAVQPSSGTVDVFESRPTWDDTVENQRQRITDEQTPECVAD
ncbi:uncharacterized protein LOC144054745 [Vanacampus margaritifer]